jgi:hypothetical protein
VGGSMGVMMGLLPLVNRTECRELRRRLADVSEF